MSTFALKSQGTLTLSFPEINTTWYHALLERLWSWIRVMGRNVSTESVGGGHSLSIAWLPSTAVCFGIDGGPSPWRQGCVGVHVAAVVSNCGTRGKAGKCWHWRFSRGSCNGGDTDIARKADTYLDSYKHFEIAAATVNVNVPGYQLGRGERAVIGLYDTIAMFSVFHYMQDIREQRDAV